MCVLDQIKNIINTSKDGTIFFVNSFSQFNEEYVTKVLANLANEGLLVRVAFGIYAKPIISKFGLVYPSNVQIAEAIAKRDNAQILPTGITALNMLGFSTQVPMKTEYLTNGSDRTIVIGNHTIRFRRSVPRTFAYKGKMMPILVQALKAIGNENVSEEDMRRLRYLISKYPEKETWNDDIKLAPAWIRKILVDVSLSEHVSCKTSAVAPTGTI